MRAPFYYDEPFKSVLSDWPSIEIATGHKPTAIYMWFFALRRAGIWAEIQEDGERLLVHYSGRYTDRTARDLVLRGVIDLFETHDLRELAEEYDQLDRLQRWVISSISDHGEISASSIHPDTADKLKRGGLVSVVKDAKGWPVTMQGTDRLEAFAWALRAYAAWEYHERKLTEYNQGRKSPEEVVS